MTAYTSTQTGDFSSVSTWGGSGYPSADGDTWTIASGHTVTYDVASALSSGFEDCTVNAGGRFQFASGSRSIRFQGNVFVYGDWIQGAGHTVFLAGGNGHIFQLLNPSETHVKKFTGSQPLQGTTTSVATTNLSGTIPVSSSSGFSEGDWIAVYNRAAANVDVAREDEGFIIHDISGSNIYVREFVSPTDTITSVADDKIFMANVDIYRKNQRIIFGTGSNRNIRQITEVNITQGFLALDSAVTGSVVGQTVYTTGPMKSHASGSIVRKCATTVASAINTSDTTITVTDATGIAAGDEIVIESNTTTSDLNDEHPEKYTVSSVNGNNITISSGIVYPVDMNSTAYVLKLTRDCRIVNESGTVTRIYSNTNSSYFGTLMMQDVEFKDPSRTDSNSNTRFYIEGRWRSDDNPTGGFMEGVSIHYTTSRDYQELYLYRYLYNFTVRCCVIHNPGYRGFYNVNGYDNDDIGLFNNHCSRSETDGFYLTNTDGEHSEVAYNRSCGADDNGFVINGWYLWGNGVHHNSSLMNKRRGFYFGGDTNYGCYFFQNEALDAGESPIYQASSANFIIQYNRFLDPYTPSDYLDVFTLGDQRESLNTYAHSIEHNFHQNVDAIYGRGFKAVWDEDEKAYKHDFDDDSGEYSGVANIIYVPGGATLRARAVMKVVDGFSGTYPRLMIEPVPAREGGSSQYAQFDSTDRNADTGAVNTVAATSSDWQNVDCTLVARDIDRFVNVSMSISSDSSSEGFYLRRLHVFLDEVPKAQQTFIRHRINEPCRVEYRNTFTQAKKRIGGRIG